MASSDLTLILQALAGDRNANPFQEELDAHSEKTCGFTNGFSTLSPQPSERGLPESPTKLVQPIISNYLANYSLPDTSATLNSRAQSLVWIIDDRENAVTPLRKSFSGIIVGNNEDQVLNGHWLRIRNCMELFAVRSQ